jgi:hypothetical protein
LRGAGRGSYDFVEDGENAPVHDGVYEADRAEFGESYEIHFFVGVGYDFFDEFDDFDLRFIAMFRCSSGF